MIASIDREKISKRITYGIFRVIYHLVLVFTSKFDQVSVMEYPCPCEISFVRFNVNLQKGPETLTRLNNMNYHTWWNWIYLNLISYLLEFHWRILNDSITVFLLCKGQKPWYWCINNMNYSMGWNCIYLNLNSYLLKVHWRILHESITVFVLL